MTEIKAIWGFDHIPDGTQPWLFSDMPVGPAGGNWNQQAFVGTFNGRRWVGGTSSVAYIAFNVNDLNFNWTKRLIWGSRFYTSNPAQLRLWSFYNSAASAALGVTEVMGSTIGVQANQEVYIEMELDIVGQKRNFYIDGNPVPIFTQAITTAQYASILSTFMYCIVGVNNSANVWWMRDVVFRHCSAPDDISIMGPVDLTMWNPVTVTPGSGFVGPVGVSSVQAVSTFMSNRTTSPYAPRLESSAGSSGGGIVARLGVDPSKVVGNVKAVTAFTSTQDIATTPHTLNAKLTQNNVDAALTGLLQKATYQYGKTQGILPLAPDGSAWDVTKINATDLTLSIT